MLRITGRKLKRLAGLVRRSALTIARVGDASQQMFGAKIY
jgi:hypothetical protein